MVQVPAASYEITLEETVQMLGVNEVNVFNEFTEVAELVTLFVVEEAVGVTVVPLFAGEASKRVSVCEVRTVDVIRKDCWTGSAAGVELSPGCVAVITHVPAAIGVIFNPPTVQIPVVDEVSVTVKFDDAVAADAKLPAETAFVPGLLKVIVWAVPTGASVKV